MTSRVLFVDDEPSMLRGLRRMLFEYSDMWDIQFAESGQQALELFAEAPFDVIVADLQMPGMDGVDLLSTVRHDYPGTMRVILSGYSDKGRVIDSTRVAHQFLSKPSSPEMILGTVVNLLALQAIPLNESIRSAVCKLESLPVLPCVFDELQNIINAEEASLDEITSLVMKDMGLTASVLKLVNTSFFGLPLHIIDPSQAVSLLGLGNMRGLLSRDDFITKFDTNRFCDYDQEILWGHSLTTARYAKTIMALEGAEQKEVECAYIGGMLHDLGKLILAEIRVEEYGNVVELAKEKNITILEAEKEVLGATHSEVGAYLLGLWGFADSIVQSTAKHHKLEEASGDLHIIAVHAANALEHELIVLNDHYAPHPADHHHLDQGGFCHKYSVWRKACEELDESV